MTRIAFAALATVIGVQFSYAMVYPINTMILTLITVALIIGSRDMAEWVRDRIDERRAD